ncbi:MAG TPA: sulfurtransferase TusA family protein [Stellaceae bacterium]|nr:sulfurtransferase TusA family protein [Stellaceae bacterium]
MATTRLDASGLLCPLPVLKARKALKAVAIGDLLDIVATDPGAAKDFPAFCETTGNTLVETIAEGEATVYRIRRDR